MSSARVVAEDMVSNYHVMKYEFWDLLDNEVTVLLHLDAVGVPVLLVCTLPGAVVTVVDSDFTIVLHAELSSIVVAPDGVPDKEPFAVGKLTHFDCVEGVVEMLVKGGEMTMMV